MDSYNIKKWDWNLSTGFRWQQVGDHISYQRRRPVSNDLTILNLLKLKSIFFNCVYWQRVNSFLKKEDGGVCLIGGEKKEGGDHVLKLASRTLSPDTLVISTPSFQKKVEETLSLYKNIFFKMMFIYIFY